MAVAILERRRKTWVVHEAAETGLSEKSTKVGEAEMFINDVKPAKASMAITSPNTTKMHVTHFMLQIPCRVFILW